MTIKEFAKLKKVSEATILQAIYTGKIKPSEVKPEKKSWKRKVYELEMTPQNEAWTPQRNKSHKDNPCRKDWLKRADLMCSYNK